LPFRAFYQHCLVKHRFRAENPRSYQNSGLYGNRHNELYDDITAPSLSNFLNQICIVMQITQALSVECHLGSDHELQDRLHNSHIYTTNYNLSFSTCNQSRVCGGVTSQLYPPPLERSLLRVSVIYLTYFASVKVMIKVTERNKWVQSLS
jgi:hypothetical protein